MTIPGTMPIRHSAGFDETHKEALLRNCGAAHETPQR